MKKSVERFVIAAAVAVAISACDSPSPQPQLTPEATSITSPVLAGLTCQDVKVRRVYEVLKGANGKVEQDQLVTNAEINSNFQDMAKDDQITLKEVKIVNAANGTTVFGFCIGDQGKQLGYYKFDGTKWNLLNGDAEDQLTALCPSAQAPEAEPGTIQPLKITAPVGAKKIPTIFGYKNCLLKNNRADWQDAGGIPNPNAKPAPTIEAQQENGWRVLQAREELNFKTHNIDFKLKNNSDGYMVKFNQVNFEQVLQVLDLCNKPLRYPRVGISFVRMFNDSTQDGVTHWPDDGTWSGIMSLFSDPWVGIELATETSGMKSSNQIRNEIGVHEVTHSCQPTEEMGDLGYHALLEMSRKYRQTPNTHRGRDENGLIIGFHEVQAYDVGDQYVAQNLPLFISWDKPQK